VALLRGINVGGRASIKMDTLRDVFAQLGHRDVQTYVQSGNVMFTSLLTEPSQIGEEAQQRIALDLGVNVTVIIRTAAELEAILRNNPYIARKADPAKLHVTFLAEQPEMNRSKSLNSDFGRPDELSIDGREVYLHCPNGYGTTKLNNTYLERRLAVPATTRNWKTVTKLRELTSE
jgi:uncharacterized protein (DUF1697 family)